MEESAGKRVIGEEKREEEVPDLSDVVATIGVGDVEHDLYLLALYLSRSPSLLHLKKQRRMKGEQRAQGGSGDGWWYRGERLWWLWKEWSGLEW